MECRERTLRCFVLSEPVEARMTARKDWQLFSGERIMIQELNLANIREGVWAGSLSLQITLSPDELKPERLLELEEKIDARIKRLPLIQVYVPKSVEPEQAERFLAQVWSKYSNKAKIHVITHETKLRVWFSWAHWLTIKTTSDRVTGVPANEYHVMFTKEDLKAQDTLVFLPQTNLFAINAPDVEIGDLARWLWENSTNPWRILSPQKTSLSEKLL
jgi:hypothetical protein